MWWHVINMLNCDIMLRVWYYKVEYESLVCLTMIWSSYGDLITWWVVLKGNSHAIPNDIMRLLGKVLVSYGLY